MTIASTSVYVTSRDLEQFRGWSTERVRQFGNALVARRWPASIGYQAAVLRPSGIGSQYEVFRPGETHGGHFLTQSMPLRKLVCWLARNERRCY